MKKSFIVILLIALIGLPVFADQAVVQLKVSVDTSLTLTSSISSIATLTTLDNSIGNVTVASNVSSWILTVKSINGGYLKATDSGNTTHYPYKLTVGAVNSIDLSDTVNHPLNTYTLTGTAASVTYPVSVQFASTPATLGLPAGTYTDQLYITLATP
jgi:hypothetical protein